MSKTDAPIKVLLVDDHALFREGVAEILATKEDLQVVGRAGDGEEAVALVLEEKPDVVLLDIEMPGLGAEETLRRILRSSPSSKVLILTMHDESHLVRELMAVGARAYVVKSATREELISAIHTVKRNDDRVILSVSRDTLESLKGQEEGGLSSRELEILSLVAKAMSNAQVASHLYISEGTVKRHLTNIYAKLGARSRVEAVNKAVTDGLITTGMSSETADRR